MGADVLLTELRAAIAVGHKLDSLQVPWLIGGSVASSILGDMRPTTDVDLVADLRGPHVARLFALLKDEFYVDEDAMRWAVRERRSFNVIHDASITKVDVFCARDEPLWRDELARRLMLDVGEAIVPVATPEDIILQKLLWFREGGGLSERQWSDAAGVVSVHRGELELAYLERHARVHLVDDLLAKLLGG